MIPRTARNDHPPFGTRAQKGSLDRLPEGDKAVKNFLYIFNEYNKNIGVGGRGVWVKARVKG